MLLSKHTMPLVVQPGVLLSPPFNRVGSMNGSCTHELTIMSSAKKNTIKIFFIKRICTGYIILLFNNCAFDNDHIRQVTCADAFDDYPITRLGC